MAERRPLRTAKTDKRLRARDESKSRVRNSAKAPLRNAATDKRLGAASKGRPLRNKDTDTRLKGSNIETGTTVAGLDVKTTTHTRTNPKTKKPEKYSSITIKNPAKASAKIGGDLPGRSYIGQSKKVGAKVTRKELSSYARNYFKKNSK